MELKYIKNDILNIYLSYSNRTFMELKSANTTTPPSAIFDSNRTFMELKFATGRFLSLTPSALQSHLYGIEISPLNVQFAGVEYSNRTFMELKLVKNSLPKPNGSKLQSHLYGIEIG